MQSNECATIARLGGIVHINDDCTAIDTMSVLEINKCIEYNYNASQHGVRIHLSSLVEFSIEHDDRIYHLTPHQELILSIFG